MKGQMWSQKLIGQQLIIQDWNKAVLEAEAILEMIPEPETTLLKEMSSKG